MPSKEEADLLRIPMTLPVLEVVRVGPSARDGLPIEVTMYVIPSDRVETVQVLERDEAASGHGQISPATRKALARSSLGGRSAEHDGLARRGLRRGVPYVDDDDTDVVRPSSLLGEGDELRTAALGSAADARTPRIASSATTGLRPSEQIR